MKYIVHGSFTWLILLCKELNKDRDKSSYEAEVGWT